MNETSFSSRAWHSSVHRVLCSLLLATSLGIVGKHACQIVVSETVRTPKGTPQSNPSPGRQKQGDKQLPTGKARRLSGEAPPVTEVERQQALDYLVSNLASYNHDKEEWSIRGIGWLHTRHNLSLTLQLPTEPLLPGRNIVRVRDTNGMVCDPSMFTIWIMVGGPEIFAGSAIPDPDNGCAWYYDFELHVPGNYAVDAKILAWNADVDVHNQKSECKTEEGSLPEDAFPINEAVTGNKFYDPVKSCCEVCSRKVGCVHWTFPAGGSTGDIACILHFNNQDGRRRLEEHRYLGWSATENNEWWQGPRSTHEEGVHRKLEWSLSEYPIQHGDPKKEETAYYIGCGWSFWLSQEHPCRAGTDDSIHGSGSYLEFTLPSSPEVAGSSAVEVSASLRRTTVDEEYNAEGRRWCDASDESLSRSRGRWVHSPFPDSTICPLPVEIDEEWSPINNIIKHDPERPHCWHRDDLTEYGKMLKDMTVSGLWNSYLHDENTWYGVWRQYDCDYEEFTDESLQSCVDRLGIREVQLTGASLANHIRYYLDQRLANIRLPEGGQRKIILDTLQIPHKLWHSSVEDWRQELLRMPNLNGDPTESTYWITGFYFSSERVAHAMASRSEQFAKMSEAILTPKGYTMINALDLTAAFTFDTALQSDGLHIMGPPAKMLIVKFFHHLCTP